jgi:hypothetical protein
LSYAQTREVITIIIIIKNLDGNIAISNNHDRSIGSFRVNGSLKVGPNSEKKEEIIR